MNEKAFRRTGIENLRYDNKWKDMKARAFGIDNV